MPAFFFVPERSRHASDSARRSSVRLHRAAKRTIYSGRFRVPVCEVSALRDSYIIPPHTCKRGAL